MRVVLCNCSPGESRRLARALVQEGLAACVNVIPNVSSVYVWEGELHEDDEHTLLVKVAADRVDAMRERLRALHSNAVPEIVVLHVDVETSHGDYVEWVRNAAPLSPDRREPE